MYISLRSKHPEFRPLGRCAPIAADSGLRPETHQSRLGKADSQKALNGPQLYFLVLLLGIYRCGGNHGATAVSARYGGIRDINRCPASPAAYPALAEKQLR